MRDVKKNDPPPPLIPPKAIPVAKPNQVKSLLPKIVIDNQVKEQIEDIKDDQVISDQTIKNDVKGEVIQAPVAEVLSNVIEAPKVKEEDIIFTTVQNEAEFSGGQQAWSRYLQKNLNPDTPVENGAPAGTYQVVVKFIVSKDGSISDVHAETKHGFGMEEEAVKIIQRGPKWIPALQNGRNVNAYRRQPVTFIVSE